MEWRWRWRRSQRRKRPSGEWGLRATVASPRWQSAQREAAPAERCTEKLEQGRPTSVGPSDAGGTHAPVLGRKGTKEVGRIEALDDG